MLGAVENASDFDLINGNQTSALPSLLIGKQNSLGTAKLVFVGCSNL
jgi:hypothetical protein